nr:hypothetical protein [Tanacetum cinerariifolium]
MYQEHLHTITSSTYRTKDKEWLKLRHPFCVGKGGGALGALGANKSSTHLGPLDLKKATCALEVEVIRALDLVEEEASCLVGHLDVVCHTPKQGLDRIRVWRRDVIAYIARDQLKDHYMDV